MDHTQANPGTFWDERYGASEAIWSGNVNTAFAEAVSDLELEQRPAV